MQSRPGRGYGPCVGGCEPGLSVTGCVAGPARARAPARAPLAGPARRRSARLEPPPRFAPAAGGPWPGGGSSPLPVFAPASGAGPGAGIARDRQPWTGGAVDSDMGRGHSEPGLPRTRAAYSRERRAPFDPSPLPLSRAPPIPLRVPRHLSCPDSDGCPPTASVWDSGRAGSGPRVGPSGRTLRVSLGSGPPSRAAPSPLPAHPPPLSACLPPVHTAGSRRAAGFDQLSDGGAPGTLSLGPAGAD
jgi:hypothetical protein